jgi:hypothetical protein
MTELSKPPEEVPAPVPEVIPDPKAMVKDVEEDSENEDVVGTIIR